MQTTSSTSSTTSDSIPALTFRLQLQAGDLNDHWKRCNMLANYLAEYVSYQFSEREWAENLISTVTNELLEAVSSVSPAASTLVLRCRQQHHDLVIELEHDLLPEIAQPYAIVLAELANQVSDEHYLHQLTSDRPLPSFNQLGLSMITHDFGVQITGTLNDSQNHAALQLIVPIQTPHI
jgi:hypothetical protein